MKRFMKFSDIIEAVSSLIQPGLIIKSVSTNQTLMLNEFVLKDSTQSVTAFTDEDRNIVQTIDPNSVWELVNIEFDGDIVQ